jgi:16S rRNA (guanine527-N7)-methyltransferase
VTAECAAPFLSLGGALVVSEPPPSSASAFETRAKREAVAIATTAPELEERWPPGKLQELGFTAAVEWRAGGFRYAVLRTERLCPERYPRRTGIPTKRPLF